MSINSKIGEIRSFFASAADPAIVEKYSRYFKEGYDAWGIRSELLESQREIWFQNWTAEGFTHRQCIELGEALFESSKYEEGALAIWLLSKQKKEFDKDTLHTLESWLTRRVSNWAHTDYICAELMPVFFRRQIIGYKDILHWQESQSVWQRRALPVSFIKLLKDMPDFEPLLFAVDPMMCDESRPVQQGLGWFLREAWKKKPEMVEGFLFRWKDEASRLIFQYATEKMKPDQKLLFRKSKSRN